MKKIVKIILITLTVLLFAFPKGYFILDKAETTSVTSVSIKSYYRGIATYLINLDRSKERLKYVMPKVEKLPFHFERISAIEGQTLTDKEIQKSVDFSTYLNLLGHFPKKGTIGCYLSHVKSWQTFLKSDFEFALILEDDIDFDPVALSEAVNQLILNKKYWDINNFETRHHGAPLLIKKINNNSDLVIYLTDVTHAGAYLISRESANKLLEKSFPIKMPIDHYFTRSWEFGLKFTGIEPRLVFQNYGDSNISSTSRAKEKFFDSSFTHILIRPIFVIHSSLIKFFYNLGLYFKLKFLINP